MSAIGKILPIAILAALLTPAVGVQAADSLATSNPWNLDSIYGCQKQSIPDYPVMLRYQPKDEAFKLDGQLPKGLVLDAKSGLITGTPEEVGSFRFTVLSEINPEFPKQDFAAVIDEACRPKVDVIEPNKGSNLGGTEIIITGSGFDERATVEFDNHGKPMFLKDIKVEPERITAVMPEYAGVGSVTLTIRNPDGSRWVGVDAFTYDGEPTTPTQFLQPLIDGVPSFGTLLVGQPIADDPRRPELGKIIRTDGTPGVFEVSNSPLIPDLRIVVATNKVDGSTTAALVGTPVSSGPYSFTITTRVEGARPDTYSFEFTGEVRYATSQTVTFRGNGSDSGFMAAQSSNIKAPLSTNVYARSGYTFNGWSTSPAGGGSIYVNNGLYEFAANVTLYAQWAAIAPVAHTIVFNGNGATSGSMVNQVSSVPAPVNANQFARAGYIFEEWNTLAAGGGSIYYPGQTFSFTQDITLYAIWKLPPPSGGGGDVEVYRTITYDGNGATSGSTPSQTSRVPAPVRENGFVRPGYKFHDWNSMPDHSGFELDPGDTYSFNADLKLYAQWDKIAPATVIVTVEKPLVIDLLAGEVRTLIVKVANIKGELIPATFEIPAGMIKVNSKVKISPHTTDASWAAGVITLGVDFTDASGKDISELSAVLEIQFSTRLNDHSVAKSDDGLTWVAIPKLAGTTLPVGQSDGYYLNADGAAIVLSRHLTEFGYKLPQPTFTASAPVKSLQVGLAAQITTKGGSGIGGFVYKSLTPTICSSTQLGVLKAVKVGACSIQITRNGDETYVQSQPKLVNLTVTPGVVVLAVQKAVVGTRQVVVAATKVQFELGIANAKKTVGVELSPTSNGLYKVVAAIKLDKNGSATFVRKIVAGTTIRVRFAGSTLTSYKFLGI